MELFVQDVCKKIHGKTILDSITLHLHGGYVYGFAGPNGCGKTMLFRALSGLMSIDSGIIALNGKVLRQDFNVLPSLGIVLENVGLFPGLTGFQNLEYLAGMKRKIGKSEIRQAITRVGLDPNDRRTYKKYSLGMKQRLAVAQAIMEQPDVIMLDEPTNALDRNGVKLIRKIIMEEKARGALILVASHNPEDLCILADHVYEMENGSIIMSEVAYGKDAE